MNSIYQPAEDSFLMSKLIKQQIPKLLKQNPNLKFLEIGAGSGIHLETAKNLGIKNIFSSDINPKSVSHCKALGFNCIQSNLFENIKDVWYPADCTKRCHRSGTSRKEHEENSGFPRFDLIIFNPPYLPDDKCEPKNSKLSTTGGKKGNEIILQFLKQSKNHLEENGKIFLITSSLSENIDFEKLDYYAKEIGCEKLFFEKLCIWELELKI